VRDHRDYVQGYLQLEQRSSIRVRSDGEHAWLNIKGATLGASRAEFEYEIPLADAKTMLQTLCVQPLISKRRHHVPYGGHVFEIDEFHGANAGLIVAEIELTIPMSPSSGRTGWGGKSPSSRAITTAVWCCIRIRNGARRSATGECNQPADQYRPTAAVAVS